MPTPDPLYLKLPDGSDSFSLEFYNPKTNKIEDSLTISFSKNSAIGNNTSFNLEKDYFIPSNGLSISIEDDRIYQLNQFIQRGWKVRLTINSLVNMIGYIFNIKLEYDHGRGSRLNLHIKDLLGYMEQGTVYPNLGTGLDTNFHFGANTKLSTALQSIASAFKNATNPGDIEIEVDDRNTGTFATGFNQGLKGRGKNQIKSIHKSLERLTTPRDNETYLHYMVRLAKHAGRNIKMSNFEENVIIVKPPTYGITAEGVAQFRPQIIHYIIEPENVDNNVISASYNFNMDHQYSVVIMQANTIGDGKFYRSALKAIAVNELTAYPLFTNKETLNIEDDTIDSVKNAIKELIDKKQGTGYIIVEPNQELYDLRRTLPIDINTEISLPYWDVDKEAHTADETAFGAAQLLAEQQDKYIECVYRFKGWSVPGENFIWQPDIMVDIIDGTFCNRGQIPESPFSKGPGRFSMWVRRVNLKKNRGEGTIAEVVCTLPFTHRFNIPQPKIISLDKARNG